MLARSKNGEGTLTIGEDNTRLWYEFEAPDTQAGRDLMENIRLGNVFRGMQILAAVASAELGIIP